MVVYACTLMTDGLVEWLYTRVHGLMVVYACTPMTETPPT